MLAHARYLCAVPGTVHPQLKIKCTFYEKGLKKNKSSKQNYYENDSQANGSGAT